MDISCNIQSVKGIGPARAKLLSNLGITTIEDALYHFPRDYLDLSPLNFKQGKPGQTGAFPCIVTGACVGRRAKSGIYVAKVPISDGQNRGYAVFFNQPFICKTLYKGDRLLLIGRIKKIAGSFEFSSPQWIKFARGKLIDIDRISPVYGLTKGLTQKTLRQMMKQIFGGLRTLEDPLPDDLRENYSLMPLEDAVRNLHFPENFDALERAKYRIVFEELLIFQLALGLSKQEILREKRKNLYPYLDTKKFTSSLPFTLTSGQQRVITDIIQDLKRNGNMHRLVQGDVGSGKTVVASTALYLTVKNGFQGVMMAPTEILASQHYQTLKELFHPLNIRVELLKGGTPDKTRNAILSALKDGTIDILVGTHAVIQEDVVFSKLGMVVTDEQHRFGVRQRESLVKKGQHPDVIVMSATPIPRTVALVLYSDLDISVIDTLPAGRQKVETYVVNRDMRRRVYDFMAKEVQEGHLAYIVCPAVEENELEVTNVEELKRTLSSNYPKLAIEMLHGKMKPAEKDEIIRRFMEREIQVLVSTTVVEVGVDVPQATLMIVEDAERFGLAQLHQLRGRVGRSPLKSYCILISESQQENARTRLSYLTGCHDGFKIAQRDLELRGPGEFLGVKQHGFFNFKMAGFVKDAKALELTKKLADNILASGCLSSPQYEKLYRKALQENQG